MNTSTSDSTSANSEDSSAPSPRPSPRLVSMVQHLPSQFEVCGRATGLEIVQHDRLAVAWRLRKGNVARNDGIEHLSGKVPVHLVATLERDEDPVGGHQSVDRQETQRRWAIDDDKVVGGSDRLKRLA